MISVSAAYSRPQSRRYFADSARWISGIPVIRAYCPCPAADRVDRRLLRELGTVEVGEALREVDRAVLVGEARHLGEDGRAEPLETAGKRGPHPRMIPARRR